MKPSTAPTASEMRKPRTGWNAPSRSTMQEEQSMKTADLIRRLQEADPTGELECVVGGEDVYFVQRLPMYYDGLPTLLVHDPSKRDREWSIVGLKVPDSGGEKGCI